MVNILVKATLYAKVTYRSTDTMFNTQGGINMDTVSIVFLLCTITLLSVTIALSASLEVQRRYEREIARKMRMTIMKIDEQMNRES